MNAYTDAIADIGETLISLLQEGLSKAPFHLPKSKIVLFSPGEIKAAEDPPRLCLFLYHVAENPHLKNRGMERITDERSKYPSLYLDLHYMLIPYESSNITDKTDKTVEEHRVLGRSMQTFHDNAILRDPVLKGGLAGKGLEIKLTQNPVSLDEMVKLWQAFQTKPYKPSVCYLVTPVAVESNLEKYTKRVSEARI